MRSEQEMFDLILNTAREDERIRAVIMNGSRANPCAPRDIFQDFDIVYLVTDTAPFIHNLEWISQFGELMILQMPDEMGDPPPDFNLGFTYLMQFMDGNRIDLHLAPVSQMEKDSLTVVLLDKDGLCTEIPLPTEQDYLPKPPTAKEFADCCNEFWWVCPYVAKGLWREEITYAKYMLDVYVRAQLMKMLRWHIGIKTQFSINPGKLGKYFQPYLEAEYWEMLMRTYADASYEHTWDALLPMTTLFRQTANEVARFCHFPYPADDDARVTAHLLHVRQLPKDADSMY